MRTTASWWFGILEHEVKHPAHGGFAVVIAVELLEHISDLFLCKSLGVETPRKALAVLLPAPAEEPESADESCRTGRGGCGTPIGDHGYRYTPDENLCPYSSDFQIETLHARRPSYFGS